MVDLNRRQVLGIVSAAGAGRWETRGSSVFPVTSTRMNPLSQETPCLDIFKKYAIQDPDTLANIYETYEEGAERTKNLRTAADFLNITIEGYESVVHTHYGDTQEGRSEFLDALEKSTDRIAEQTEDPLFDELHWYTAQANYLYESITERPNIVQEYASLAEGAYELRQGPDADSLKDALELGFKSYTDQLEEDFVHVALETATRPFEEAVTGLNILSRQLLLGETYAESQLPLLEKLERLAEKRRQGTISKSEMYGYMMSLTEFYAARARFAEQIYQLQQIGISESILTEWAQKVRLWLNETFGYGTGQSFRELAETPRSDYESAVISLAEFHKEMKQHDDCSVDVDPPDRIFVVESITDDAEFDYRFIVDGDAEGTEASGVSADDEEDVQENSDGTVTVVGSTGDGYGDAFSIEGEIDSFEKTGGESEFELYLDGEEVTDEYVDDDGDSGATLEVMSTSEDSEFSYQFTVDGDAEKTQLGEGGTAADDEEEIEDNDDGTVTVTGSTGQGYGDAFIVRGEIESFERTGGESGFELYRDGEEVTDKLTDED